jgi:hypothetical protein
LGVSVASRSITALRQVSFSGQSAQALAFAEAGAEEALLCLDGGGACSGGSIDLDGGGDDVTYTVTPLSSTDLPKIDRDSTIELTLVGYGGASATVCWSLTSISSETNAALTVAYVRSGGGDYFLSRYSYDPDGSRRAQNNFSNPSPGSGSCAGYRYMATIPTPATRQILRLRPLYVGPVTIAAPGLPVQGSKIASTGFSGRVIRKIEAIRTNSALSEIFDYVLFSGSESSALAK